MGNYSRDPEARLSDSRAKHYVRVLLQQGVPVLDADINESDGLRRMEFEDLTRTVIGNGVPLGNDGFRILPIAGGGLNTIVLSSKKTGAGQSSVKINLAASSAAAALGFDASNSVAQRLGSSPARLTGNKTQPFVLGNNSTLVIEADGEPAQTVTLGLAFSPIARSAGLSAEDVAAAINNAAIGVTASVGTGNDFIIRGGDGSVENAGRIIVDGLVVFNNSDLRYSEQPLYKNTDLAALWDVGIVPELITPTSLPFVPISLDLSELVVERVGILVENQTVFLDVWHREVDSDEDRELIDERIGVETTVREERAWAVRVTKTASFQPVLDARPAGHSYYVLAHVNRTLNDPRIKAEMISDERETDLALRREVRYLGADASVVVNSTQFRNTLIQTRDGVRDFALFLTTKFVEPDSDYVAGEVLGLESLLAIAVIADQGISLLNAKSLDTKGALALLGQLFDAQQRFVTVWRAAVLPVVKPGGTVYAETYERTIRRIEGFLGVGLPISVLGPPYVLLTIALLSRDLFQAVNTQGLIAREFRTEADRPTGLLLLKYLGSLTSTIVKNEPFDVRYRVTGSVTPKDDLNVSVIIDPAWKTTVKNADGSTPFGVQFGPGNDSKDFVVTVVPPSADIVVATSDPNTATNRTALLSPTTPISVQVSARGNPSAVTRTSTPKTLTVGSPPPDPDQDFVITIETASVKSVDGQVFNIPIPDPEVRGRAIKVTPKAVLSFRLTNNTSDPSTSLLVEFDPAPPLWVIEHGKLPTSIPASNSTFCSFTFSPPQKIGARLDFTLRLKGTSAQSLPTLTITLVTVKDIAKPLLPDEQIGTITPTG